MDINEILCNCGHPAREHGQEDNYKRCWGKHYECTCKLGHDDVISSYIDRLRAVDAAAREYRSITSYPPAADGSCSQCDALSSDPNEHAEWCDYRKAVTALDAALDRRS